MSLRTWPSCSWTLSHCSLQLFGASDKKEQALKVTPMPIALPINKGDDQWTIWNR